MISLDKKLTLGTVQFGMNYGVSNKTGIPNQTELKNIINHYIYVIMLFMIAILFIIYKLFI